MIRIVLAVLVVLAFSLSAVDAAPVCKGPACLLPKLTTDVQSTVVVTVPAVAAVLPLVADRAKASSERRPHLVKRIATKLRTRCARG